MAVADEMNINGSKRSQPRSTFTKSKKIGRPAHGGAQCSHPGCGNKAQTKGKCRTHTGGGKCSHSGCDKQAQFKGLCAGHGGRRICSQPGCEKKVASRGKCSDHGGGKPSSLRERRASTLPGNKRKDQNDGTFSMLTSAAAVMSQVAAFPVSHGSMVSLLLGGDSQEESAAMAIPANREGVVQITQSAASDVISEVLL
ncbi:hypothetical protein PHYPSEUDO_007670 [Phytophthora pseudosyringae]|uniref:WRKY transcription factor 19 n=1 Tax=Phytophthora pseudosyringae TaxID=221518 RepID=A0A8T1VJ20_9STRA|nr:hypothetical protein PHYPSEUDO_007670 [Phytophthora pseudosyringae]